MTARRRVDEPGRVGPEDLLAALGELGCGRTAEVYAALGFPVVAMHAPRPGGGCTCRAGPSCSEGENGKTPWVCSGRR